MRISDWSSDVCSSDLLTIRLLGGPREKRWPMMMVCGSIWIIGSSDQRRTPAYAKVGGRIAPLRAENSLPTWRSISIWKPPAIRRRISADSEERYRAGRYAMFRQPAPSNALRTAWSPPTQIGREAWRAQVCQYV